MTPTTLKQEFTIQSSILDRPRLLTIHPEYLEFDDKDLRSAPPTRFDKQDIREIRFGIKGIHGYRFRIGRIYCIDVRNTAGQIINIRLKSIYRIRLKQLNNKYENVRDALFSYYFTDIIAEYLQLLKNDLTFEIQGVRVGPLGIWLDKTAELIPWEFIGTKRYWHYFTLFSASNPEYYKAFEYIEQFNGYILYATIDVVLKSKFPERK